MNKTPDSSPEDDDEFRTLKLRRSPTDTLETKYTNHFSISFTGTEFYLVFGEIIPPAIIDEKDLSNLPDFVDIKPIARLAISPETMLKISDAISRTVGNYLKRNFGDES